MRWIASVLVLLGTFVLYVPGAQAQEFAPEGNLMRPGDELLMRIWPDSTLSGRFRIEENGQAYFPIIGAIPAAGRTPEDLRDALVDQYSEVMQSPVILLTPRFRVLVLGAGPAGLHWVERGTTMFEFFASRGGLPDNADVDNISLQRRGEMYRVNIEAALRDNLPIAETPLHSGDRILVPEKRNWRGIFTGIRFVVQSATLVFTILNWADRV